MIEEHTPGIEDCIELISGGKIITLELLGVNKLGNVWQKTWKEAEVDGGWWLLGLESRG